MQKQKCAKCVLIENNAKRLYKLKEFNGSYHGDWNGMSKEGFGIFYNKSKNTLYKGEWKNNLKDGKGELIVNGKIVFKG